MLACLFHFFILVVATAQALSIHGLNTLLIYDARITNLEEYTLFLESLTKRGYNIVSESVSTNNSIKIYEGDNRLYDNLILFPLKTRVISKQISVNTLLQFSSDGGDILAVTSPDGLTEHIRLFLKQLDIYPSPKDFYLQDYFQGENSSILYINDTNVENKHVYSSHTPSTLVYSGSAALLGNSELIIPILAAPRTSFTKGKKDGEWTIGSQGYLMAAVQNKHNSRTMWVGSTSFFNDQNFNYNGGLIKELCKWTFREKSVIKSIGVKYSPDSDIVPYKIKDEIEYEIGFSEWDGVAWIPYIADDIQFELKMIDPYYRITMKPVHSTSDTQYYSTGIFQLPDHHGVYTFITRYERSGISFVEEKDVKPIRHLANDEYARSFDITNAWVNIVSIYTIIIWFIAFVFIYLSSPFSNVVEKAN